MCTLKMSDSTANLFIAVANMQESLTNASKNKKGHNYSYADLAECLETAREPLAKNGLCVIQQMGMTSNGENTLFTTLAHVSGEYMQSETIIPKANLSGSAKGNPVQEMGASITYMRRYCFAAIIGLTQEDTDGANKKLPPNNEKDTPPNKSNAKPTQQTAQKQPSLAERRKNMYAILLEDCGSPAHVLAYVSTALNKSITGFEELTVQDISIIGDYYKSNKPVKQSSTLDDLPFAE